jgi:hypothetical protein
MSKFVVAVASILATSAAIASAQTKVVEWNFNGSNLNDSGAGAPLNGALVGTAATINNPSGVNVNPTAVSYVPGVFGGQAIRLPAGIGVAANAGVSVSGGTQVGKLPYESNFGQPSTRSMTLNIWIADYGQLQADDPNTIAVGDSTLSSNPAIMGGIYHQGNNYGFGDQGRRTDRALAVFGGPTGGSDAGVTINNFGGNGSGGPGNAYTGEPIRTFAVTGWNMWTLTSDTTGAVTKAYKNGVLIPGIYAPGFIETPGGTLNGVPQAVVNGNDIIVGVNTAALQNQLTVTQAGSLAGLTGGNYGLFDEFTIWEGALSQANIQQLYTTNAIPEPTTLAALAGAGVMMLRRRK